VKHYSGTIEPKELEGGKFGLPDNVYFLLEAINPQEKKKPATAKLSLSFVVGDQELAWKKSGMDLREQGDHIALTNTDIPKH